MVKLPGERRNGTVLCVRQQHQNIHGDEQKKKNIKKNKSSSKVYLKTVKLSKSEPQTEKSFPPSQPPGPKAFPLWPPTSSLCGAGTVAQRMPASVLPSPLGLHAEDLESPHAPGTEPGDEK